MADPSETSLPQTPREGHRFLRHVCVSGLVLCALASIKGLLPAGFREPLVAERALGLEIGWMLPATGLGFLVSWLLRRHRLLVWRHLAGVGAAGVAVAFGWLGVRGDLPTVSAVLGAWGGVLIVQSYAATSQRTYDILQWVSLILLMAGGWRQATDVYPQLLAASLGLLLFSSLAARASPVGVADVYVDARYPGVEHTLARGFLLIVTVGLAAWPIYAALPRPDDAQEELFRALLCTHMPGLMAAPAESEFAGQRHARHLLTPRPMRLSRFRAPEHSGQTLLMVRGPGNPAWRQSVLDDYDGRTWRLRKGRLRPVRTAGQAQGGRAVLGRKDGAARGGVSFEHYTVHVLQPLGAGLIRPSGTVVVSVPGRDLLRDGLGNVYVRPRLGPPLIYEAEMPETPRPWPERKTDPALLALPKMPARMRQLASELTASCETDTEKVRACMRYVERHCRYALVPYRIPFDRDATDYFLFERRQGWCIHFASALAVLCRLADVPSRVVVGFGSGEREAFTGTIRITDREAHAWVEACVDEGLWREFDPAPAEQSPLARAKQRTIEEEGGMAEVAAVLLQEGEGLRKGYDRLRREIRTRPLWIVLPLAVVGLLVGGLVWKRGQRQRRRIRSWWTDVRGESPRVAARAAYLLVTDHLERAGYGSRMHTAPTEYLQQLEVEDHPAAFPLAQIVASYGASAFGPQVSLRWNRKRLIANCEQVLTSVRMQRLFRRRRQPAEGRVVRAQRIEPEE